MAKRDLTTLKGVADELAAIYHSLDDGERNAADDAGEIRLRKEVLNSLRDVLQQTALELKLAELEALVKARFRPEIKRIA
jgi:hypothetical protein